MSTLHVENLKGLSSGGNANKVIIPTGQTLEVTDNIRHDDMPTGSIIQYLDVHENTSYVFSSNPSTNINLGLVKSITPLHSSSKIIVEGHIGANVNSTVNDGVCLTCTMNGTTQTAADGWGGIGSNGNHFLVFYHDNSHTRDFYGNHHFRISGTGLLTAGTSYTFQLRLRNWVGNASKLIYNGAGYVASTMRILEIKQ